MGHHKIEPTLYTLSFKILLINRNKEEIIMVGIYQVTNLINNKKYIGQSNDIKLRWKKHHSEPFNPNSENYNCVFYRAIRKYGIDNFKFEVLEECSLNNLNKRERYWIKQHRTYLGFKDCNGYNMTLGGDASVAHTLLSYEDVQQIQNLLLNTRISQTEIGNQFHVSQNTISDINTGYTWVDEDLNYPLRQKKYKYNYCIDCGEKISLKGKRCVKCQSIHSRLIEWPDREQLKQLIRTIPFTQIGKQYGVTDNAVRKWCDNYNLPRKSSEIKKYTDEEWADL